MRHHQASRRLGSMIFWPARRIRPGGVRRGSGPPASSLSAHAIRNFMRRTSPRRRARHFEQRPKSLCGEMRNDADVSVSRGRRDPQGDNRCTLALADCLPPRHGRSRDVEGNHQETVRCGIFKPNNKRDAHPGSAWRRPAGPLVWSWLVSAPQRAGIDAVSGVAQRRVHTGRNLSGRVLEQAPSLVGRSWRADSAARIARRIPTPPARHPGRWRRIHIDCRTHERGQDPSTVSTDAARGGEGSDCGAVSIGGGTIRSRPQASPLSAARGRSALRSSFKHEGRTKRLSG